jgi:hypothetical protein
VAGAADDEGLAPFPGHEGRPRWLARPGLAELHDELNDGVVSHAAYSVAQESNDWLADGLADRAPKTISTQREVLQALIGIIGGGTAA